MINAIERTKELKSKLLEINIDVAIIYSNFSDYQQDQRRINRLAAKIDYNFEIHLFKPDDFDNPYDPLVSEVKKYGILV